MMSDLPCKNPNCNSFGTPHPNCRCYTEMAEGGDSHFCSSSRAHENNCKYFADGGDTSPDFIPDSQVPNQNAAPDFIPDSQENAPEFISDKEYGSEKYGTPGQELLTGVEGAAQGILGPAATALELGASKLGVPGISAEDIAGREAENPAIHGLSEAASLTASLMTGIGEAGLIGRGAEAILPSASSVLGKIGSAAIKGFITNGLIQGGDEISKAMLGQGDPEAPVAGALSKIGASGLIGAATGSLFSGFSSALSDAAKNKIGSNLQDFISGAGAYSQGGDELASQIPEDVNPQMFKAGSKYLKNLLSGSAHTAAISTGISVGSALGSPYIGALAGEKFLAKPLGSILTKVSAPVVLRMVASGTQDSGWLNGLFQALDYANHANSGLQSINRALDGLFKVGGQQIINNYNPEKDRKELRDTISNGGINQNIDQSIYDQNSMPVINGFAEGGEVRVPALQMPKQKETPSIFDQNNGLSHYFPEQNMLLNAAKTRISNYLTGLQPLKNAPKLAFDDAPDNTLTNKTYDEALDIANNPLSVLQKIKDGTIEASHVKHLNAMYPEVNNVFQKKITERITKSQLKGEKPSYAIRQGLSLLLGTPLSGELAPQNIQAAQAVFQNQAMQSNVNQTPAKPVTKNKRNTSTLTKSSQAYLTGNQARSSREQKVS